MSKPLHILDTTLRDGSNAIGFSFTAADTAKICQELEQCGLQYIEVGHGSGLNAGSVGRGRAAATDEQYLASAASVVKRAKFGVFCIPGIARLQNLDMGASYGMGFVRVGTNVDEIPKSEPFIRRAKDLGMLVMASYMKSYALSPKELASHVLLSEKWGADVVYIMDSAGGMFPEDVRRYYDALREVSEIALGFHGHNNLGLAVANTLAAVEMGMEFVDSSLQGLGRSTGNAPTEVLIAALKKKGYQINIDLIRTLKAAQNLIQPIIPTKGYPILDTISGYADFHSSYMPSIRKYSAKYNLDPAILIIELCKVDKIHLDERVLESIASKLAQAREGVVENGV
jgi:4-hydroxy 2-oxovalerate aldolase/long-chain acyl-CoA synthetase